MISSPILSANDLTILISFDGFRHDYIERLPNGAFKDLINGGCRSQSLIPVNPTKTFPNHWTIATGLYPEHHGIIDNHFYDTELKDTFSMPRRESEWWHGEPIWITAERAGVRAYTYYWPGSSTSFNGKFPSRWFPYSGTRKYFDRVDSILAWSAQPSPPGLIVSYFELVDDAGHRYGPSSPQIDTALIRADSIITRLLKGLASRSLLQSTNIVIVSDHGMTQVTLPTDSYSCLLPEVFGDPSKLVILRSNPNILVYGLDTTSARAVAERINARPHIRVHASATVDLDTSWRINAPNRTPDLYVQADYGFDIDTGKRPLRALAGGNHGYDNRYTDMHGIFVASGRGIKPGRIPSLSTVDVYNIICRLVGIPPSANDGNVSRVADVVK